MGEETGRAGPAADGISNNGEGEYGDTIFLGESDGGGGGVERGFKGTVEWGKREF